MPTKQMMPHRANVREEARNPYYLRISGVYRLLKWGTLLLFTVFLAGMLLWQRDSITYENLRYLARDLDTDASGGDGFVPVAYEVQQNMRFTSFQNTLAAAGSSGIRLYDGHGRNVFSDAVSYRSPVLDSGDKYLLIYDAGGTEYSLFTTLACVQRGTTDGVIQHAAVSDSGAYCIVTQSSESKFVITLYSAAFTRSARFYRDSYVISAAIHPDGGSVAVLSADSGDWKLSAELTVYSAAAKESIRVPLGTSLPIAAHYFENGMLAVLCDDRVLWINAAGEIVSETSLSSTTLSFFSFSDNKAALVCRENVLGSSSRILVQDSTGRTLCNTVRTERVSGITASSAEWSAYIMYGDHVEAISVMESKKCSYAKPLHAVREVAGCAVLCFSDGAQTAEFE